MLQSTATAIDKVISRLILLLKKTRLVVNTNLTTRLLMVKVSPVQLAATALSKHANMFPALQETICVLSFLFLWEKNTKKKKKQKRTNLEWTI